MHAASIRAIFSAFILSCLLASSSLAKDARLFFSTDTIAWTLRALLCCSFFSLRRLSSSSARVGDRNSTDASACVGAFVENSDGKKGAASSCGGGGTALACGGGGGGGGGTASENSCGGDVDVDGGGRGGVGRLVVGDALDDADEKDLDRFLRNVDTRVSNVRMMLEGDDVVVVGGGGGVSGGGGETTVRGGKWNVSM